MVHEGTGLWHDAGFNVSRWLMIIIHGYRATTLALSILLNVLARTGEYTRFSISFSRAVSLSTTEPECLRSASVTRFALRANPFHAAPALRSSLWWSIRVYSL